MTLPRMDHVVVVVEDLDAAVGFFLELGLEAEGQQAVEGPWVDGVNGIEDVRVDVVMVRTPDGHNKLELTRFRNPTATTTEPDAPSNTLGLRSVMFEVDDLRDVVERLRAHGGELVGTIEQYEDLYVLCYVRGPAGIIVSLAEQIG